MQPSIAFFLSLTQFQLICLGTTIYATLQTLWNLWAMAADLTHYRMEATKAPAKEFALPMKKKMALYLNRGEYNSFLISALCVVLSCFLLLYASFPSGMAIPK